MKYKNQILLLFSSYFFLSSFSPVFASIHEFPELEQVINNITDTLVWVIASMLVLVIIAFGIQFVLSADNPQERSRLKQRLIWTVIGLFIILTAHPISSWLQSIL